MRLVRSVPAVTSTSRGALDATAPGVPVSSPTGPSPTEFVAKTCTVYDVPLARPVIVKERAVPGPVADTYVESSAVETLRRTVYAVIGAPPSLAGGPHVTVSFRFPSAASTAVGAPGALEANCASAGLALGRPSTTKAANAPTTANIATRDIGPMNFLVLLGSVDISP